MLIFYTASFSHIFILFSIIILHIHIDWFNGLFFNGLFLLFLLQNIYIYIMTYHFNHF